MMIKPNTPTTVYALTFEGRSDLSLALLSATQTEAQALADEAAKNGRNAAVTPMTLTLAPISDSNKPGDQL